MITVVEFRAKKTKESKCVCAHELILGQLLFLFHWIFLEHVKDCAYLKKIMCFNNHKGPSVKFVLLILKSSSQKILKGFSSFGTEKLSLACSN